MFKHLFCVLKLFSTKKIPYNLQTAICSLPMHLQTIKRDNISLGFIKSGRNGNNLSTTQFRCNINSKPGQLVSIERSPRRTPLRACSRAGATVGPAEVLAAQPLRRLLPLFQVPLLPEWLGSRPQPRTGDTSFFGQVGPRPGRGRGRKIKPQRLTT